MFRVEGLGVVLKRGRDCLGFKCLGFFLIDLGPHRGWVGFLSFVQAFGAVKVPHVGLEGFVT